MSNPGTLATLGTQDKEHNTTQDTKLISNTNATKTSGVPVPASHKTPAKN